MPEGILDDVGGCKPPLHPGRLRCGAERRRRVRDVQGAKQSRGYPRGTERKRSPEQPGPEGETLNESGFRMRCGAFLALRRSRSAVGLEYAGPETQ